MKLRRLTPEAAAARDDRIGFLVESESALGLILGLPGLLVIRLLRVGQDRIDVRMPVCQWCKDAGVKISPRHVNWDTHHIALLVHREFKDKLRLAREQKAPLL